MGQTLEIQRRVFGPEHPDTLFSMNNLAVSYDGLGKHAQAEALFNQTLDLKRRVLGPEHPSTLNTMNELAGAYVSQGKYAQAEPLYKQTLEIRRRVLGPENRDTIETATNLARGYQEQGNFAASESLARGIVEIDRRKQTDGWQRFGARSLLGASLAGQKKFAEAERLLLESYRGMDSRKDGIEIQDRHRLDRARKYIVELYEAWGSRGRPPRG